MKRYISFFIIIGYSLCFEVADAIGQNGAVASSKKEATEIGIKILQSGGNAVDAAVAVGFAFLLFIPVLEILVVVDLWS